MKLTKDNSLILARELKSRNLLENDVKMQDIKRRNCVYLENFLAVSNKTYCSEVDKLIEN